MIDEDRLDPGAGGGPAAHAERGGAQAAQLAGARLCGGKTADLGGEIGGKAQHVAQELAEIGALVRDERRMVRRAVKADRGRQAQTLGRGERAEDVAGVKGRIADREPAAARLAQRAAGDGPAVGTAAVAVVVDRQAAVDDAHLRDAHERTAGLAAGVHRDGVVAALAFPFEMDTVEVEVEPRNRRVVTEVVELGFVDLVEVGERPAPDLEAAAHLLETRGEEGFDEQGEVVRLKMRIAAAGEDEVAVKHAVDDRAGCEKAGDEAVFGAQRLDGVERGDRLGDAGGGQFGVRVVGFDDMAGAGIGQDDADGAGQTGAFDDRGDVGAGLRPRLGQRRIRDGRRRDGGAGLGTQGAQRRVGDGGGSGDGRERGEDGAAGDQAGHGSTFCTARKRGQPVADHWFETAPVHSPRARIALDDTGNIG